VNHLKKSHGVNHLKNLQGEIPCDKTTKTTVTVLDDNRQTL